MFLKKLQFHAADGESQLTRESDNLKRGGTKLNLQNDCCIFNNVGMMELVGHVWGIFFSRRWDLKYCALSKYWLVGEGGREGLIWHYATSVVSNGSHKNSPKSGELLMRGGWGGRRSIIWLVCFLHQNYWITEYLILNFWVIELLNT